MVLVRDVMTIEVLSVLPSTPLEQAQTELRLGRVRHLPVVDVRRRVVGVLSRSDVFGAAGKHGDATGLRVSDVMIENPDTIHAHQPAVLAAKLLRQQKVSCLPVVDEQGVLQGLVTATDFVAIAERALAGKPLLRP